MKRSLALLLCVIAIAVLFPGCADVGSAKENSLLGTHKVNDNNDTEGQNTDEGVPSAGEEEQITDRKPEYGYESAEELIVAINQRWFRKISEEEYRRLYTEGAWNDAEIGAVLKDNYSKYDAATDDDYQNEAVGELHEITCKITSYELEDTGAATATEESNEYSRRIFGVDMDKVNTYTVCYTLTVQGSKGEYEINQQKIVREIEGRWYNY